jgi:hypothetical protein
VIAKGMIAALAILAATSSAQAATIYAVDETNNLITFNSANPSVTLSSTALTGLNSSLAALDFRSVNNVLYGLSSDLVVYTINRVTGVATAVSGELPLVGTSFGLDFNPTIDRLRIVSNTNQNYVFNPNTGTAAQFTNVAYGAGDPNFGRDPNDTANAYTSAPFGGVTTQYAIDTGNDVLAIQANNAGTLTTVGALGVDLGSRTSFDIRDGDAFVLDGRNFFSVNLATGALTLVGETDRSLFGMAIAVPEPATWAMMLLGFAGVGGALRARRRFALTA